jgi:hypothetical protein
LELHNASQILYKTVRHHISLILLLYYYFIISLLAKIAILTGPGALSTQALRRVVLDTSHIDQKSKGILELKDTHVPLMRLLAMPALKGGYDKEEGGIQIIFY